MAEICSFASRRSLVIQIHESTFLFEKMSEFRWSRQNKWCSQSTDFNSCFSCPRHRKLDWKLGEKGWWEWGSRSPPLWCHHSSSHLCSDGTCNEYFSLKWISDNSESNNNVESRGTIHWKSSSEVNSILLLAEGRGKSWLPFFLLHPCEFKLSFQDDFLCEKFNFWCCYPYKLQRKERKWCYIQFSYSLENNYPLVYETLFLRVRSRVSKLLSSSRRRYWICRHVSSRPYNTLVSWMSHVHSEILKRFLC